MIKNNGTIFLAIVSLLLFIGLQNPCFGASQLEIDRDSYNYLIVSFHALNNGVNPANLKNQIYEYLDLTIMSDGYRELYKKYINLLDLTEKARLEIEKREGIRLAKSHEIEETQEFNTLVGIGATYLSWPIAIITAGNSLTGTSVQNARHEIAQTGALIADIKERLRSEYSDFVFDLQFKKQTLINMELTVVSELFVEDYFDEFRAARATKNDNTRYSKLQSLFDENNRLYMVAIALASESLKKGDLNTARAYLVASLDSILSIAKTSKSKVKALVMLSIVEWKDGNKRKAYDYVDKAILHIPDSTEALYTKSEMLEEEGRDIEALEILTRISGITTNSPELQYQYAVLSSKTGQSMQIVLSRLERAFSVGFNNIKEVHRENAFASIRDRQEYIKLTKQTIGFKIVWNLLAYDEVKVSNGSKYDWTNVTIRAAYKNVGDDGYYILKEQTDYSKLRNLNRGETVSLPLGPCTNVSLEFIRLTLRTDQGERDIILAIDSSGQVKLIKG